MIVGGLIIQNFRLMLTRNVEESAYFMKPKLGLCCFQWLVDTIWVYPTFKMNHQSNNLVLDVDINLFILIKFDVKPT